MRGAVVEADHPHVSRLTQFIRLRAQPFMRRLLGRAPARRGHARVVSADPLVIMWSCHPRVVEHAVLSTMPPALRQARKVMLTVPWWSLEDDEFAPFTATMRRAAAANPATRFITLCNTEAERARLAAAGHAASFISHNAFADERVFRPEPPGDVAFDAIYNAAFRDWKRHHLAASIEHLALIGYLHPSEPDALAAIRRTLPRATIMNTIGGDRLGWMPPGEVNGALNRARVGLCLSAAEGAMYASIEYLLAGLPIVSTPSIGGRDVFFDPDYCLVVPPDARAVRDAVAALIARDIPRHVVRERTLQRLAAHRARFAGLMQSLLVERRGDADRWTQWDALHRHRWLDWVDLDDFWRDVERRDGLAALPA
jgi:hypothetical protein